MTAMQIQQLGPDVAPDALRRLRKVEGQVRGLQRMITEGRDCEDVLRQIAAATNALRRVGANLAVSGLEHCVTRTVDEDPDGAATKARFRKAFLELA
jgi:CsoR family transcriptional regulator, copper-sensing transcriptional repressor